MIGKLEDMFGFGIYSLESTRGQILELFERGHFEYFPYSESTASKVPGAKFLSCLREDTSSTSLVKGKELGFKLIEKPKIAKRVRFNDENASFPSKNILAAPRKSSPALNNTEKFVKKLSARNLSQEVLSFTFSNLSV
ncbi:hypothetical protein CRE_10742 [Caenorhabditis remanei]|uniref:Uncharacterized protein n=1 Tax=Caenorhabditis remanei TaxID=31234 RepID=E3NR09_CAERE|nr:hypothetical protein CRE_10742 [Caenorhabditis remanei]